MSFQYFRIPNANIIEAKSAVGINTLSIKITGTSFERTMAPFAPLGTFHREPIEAVMMRNIAAGSAKRKSKNLGLPTAFARNPSSA